ncbi:MAG: cyclic nucleotide-binding/CBS domain-containing protein [Chloroflexi bacterium]|nr:cyclic nucleotide-binding/CBS domain-containing protein [Chloroflexota bacterium]
MQNQPAILQDLTVDFLRQHYPFDLLATPELQTLAQSCSLEFFPKDTPILAQGGNPAQSLFVIQKGSVRMSVLSENDEEIIIDMRSEGEHFGLTSMMRGTVTQMNVAAVEDTICYLFPKPLVAQMMRGNVEFAEAILQASAQRYLEKALTEIRQGDVRPSGERMLFTLPVRALLNRELVSCAGDCTIQQVAIKMRDLRISSMVIVDAHGVGIGIVTDRDLRSRVIAEGMDALTPVAAIMVSPVISIDQDDLAFEALLKMLNMGIHHLLVVEQGKAVGVITSTDLMLLQGQSPLLVAKGVNQQNSVEDLSVSLQRANQIIPLMFKEGAHPSSIGRVIAEINDRVTQKLLTLAEREFGAPPLPYCWIVLGSEGRKEQTFKTDQDNALIYADPADDAQAQAAREYFARFAEWMGDALEKCGYPRCPGDYMARNPKWCQPARVWHNYFIRWISEPEPQQALYTTIFFDLRAVGPATELAIALQDDVFRRAKGQNIFLAHLARVAIGHTPPLGFFRNFVIEKSGPHKHTFNLKERGSGPIVDLVRVTALEHGIRETNTIERLHALADTGAMPREQAEELEHTYEFLMLMRLRHQMDLVSRNDKPDNFLNPDKITAMDRTTLREAFQTVARLQADISERFMLSRLA